MARREYPVEVEVISMISWISDVPADDINESDELLDVLGNGGYSQEHQEEQLGRLFDRIERYFGLGVYEFELNRKKDEIEDTPGVTVGNLVVFVRRLKTVPS